MKKPNELTLVKAIAIAFSLMFFFFTSCRDEEQKKETVETTVVSSDTSTVKTGDTAKTTITTTTTTTTIGKPNPAKKGGKGKATIKTSPANTAEKIEVDKEGVYNRADVMPSFPGGEKELVKFMEKNLNYPQEAIDEGVEGTVELQFAVDENGKVYTPAVKSDKIGYGLEEEAIRVVKMMPKWNPGNIKGKNVKTKFTMPVTYVIN